MVLYIIGWVSKRNFNLVKWGAECSNRCNGVDEGV